MTVIRKIPSYCPVKVNPFLPFLESLTPKGDMMIEPTSRPDLMTAKSDGIAEDKKIICRKIKTKVSILTSSTNNMIDQEVRTDIMEMINIIERTVRIKGMNIPIVLEDPIATKVDNKTGRSLPVNEVVKTTPNRRGRTPEDVNQRPQQVPMKRHGKTIKLADLPTTPALERSIARAKGVIMRRRQKLSLKPPRAPNPNKK